MSEEKPFSDRVLILAEKSEPFEFTKEDVDLYASQIGINLPEEEDLTWIAEEGLQAPLPPHWLPVEDHKGRLFYYNLETDQSTWEHPSDGIYRSLVQQEKQSRASSLADAPPLNSSQASSKSSGELSEEVGIIPNASLTTDYMANFRKSSRVTPPRSVRFDLEQEQNGSMFDDFLETMDASRLSPVLQTSPEPEDVNMLLQLAPRKPPNEDNISLLSKTTKNSLQDRRDRFLKPMDVSEPFLKPMKKVEVVLINPIEEDVVTAVASSFESTEEQRRDSFKKPLLLKMDDRQESEDTEEVVETFGQEKDSPEPPEKETPKLDNELTTLQSQHAEKLKTEMQNFELEMMELNIQQSKDLMEMKSQLEKQIQKEMTRHEESMVLLRKQMSSEMEEEREKLGTQLKDLKMQHAKELELEMERFVGEMKELRSQHDKELEKMKEKMENEVGERHSLLEREQELEATKLLTQKEFLKELEDLKKSLDKANSQEMEDLKKSLNKENSQLREETATRMKIQHEKDMEEMVLKLKQDFSAGEAKILKQQHENELRKFESDLEKQLSVQKLSVQRKHEEEMEALEREYEERQQEARNRNKTDSWVRQQNEERRILKEELPRDQELFSGEQFHSLLQKMDLLDRRVGNLETRKSDSKNVDRGSEDSNRTAGTFIKNRTVPLEQKNAREAWQEANEDLASVDDSEEASSDGVSSDGYESYLQKSFNRKRSKTLRRARLFLQERKRVGRSHTNGIRLAKSVDELAARLDEEASQLAKLQKKFLRKRRSNSAEGTRDDDDSLLADDPTSSQRMTNVFHSNSFAGLSQSPIAYAIPLDYTMTRRPMQSAQQKLWTGYFGGENALLAKESSISRLPDESGDLWPNRLREMKQKIRNSQTAAICFRRMN